MSIYSGDFETTTEAWASDETYVWAGAMVDITKHADDNAVRFFESIYDFEYILENSLKDGDIIYFHNLKFDGSFILNALLEDGYKVADDIRKGPGHRVQTLISDMGIWYSIKVKVRWNKTIEIRNSLTLIQGSVASIGDSFKTRKRKLDMDYDREGGDYSKAITPKEKEYLAADVLIMAEALDYMINTCGWNKLTAGANAMQDFIDRFGGDAKFRQFFPELSSGEDEFVRSAYRGGKSDVKEGMANVDIGNGCTCDARSMYPSQMHSKSGNLYPIGKGKFFTGKPHPTKKYPLWVASCEVYMKAKPNHTGCIQIKKSTQFVDNEWLKFVGEDDEFGNHIPAEIYITNVDWALIEESYDIEYVSWNCGYAYQAQKGLFDCFIDHWYEVKKTSKGAKKQTAKIALNSFYGKFGTRPSGRSKTASVEDGVLKFEVGEEEERKGVYIPVACFTTAYARKRLCEVINSNYERFVYSDTDSVHLTGWEMPKGVTIGAELCDWAVESWWDRGYFIRQKTYMEHIVKDEDGDCDELNIRCAGMPADLKYRKYLGDDGKVHKIPNISFEQFKVGARWETGKLQAKQVKGGVLLKNVPFQIKG